MRNFRIQDSLFLLVLAACLAVPGGLSAQKVPGLSPAAQAAMASVDGEHMRWHVRYLSHDLLEGRGTGQRGGDVAAEYIGTQFALAGLKPGGDGGSYLQKVPMVGIAQKPASSTFAFVPERGADAGKPWPLRFADDYVTTDQTKQGATNIDAPMVFVGYGIQAPEYQWDDYKGVDVKGKVLVMLVNEPPSDDEKFFKGKALTFYGRWVYKFEQGARMGAVGVVLIHKTEMASYGWDVVRNSNSGEKSFLRDREGNLQSAGWIHLDVARKLMAMAGQDLDALMASARTREFKPVPLGVSLRAHLESTVRPFESNNVIGILPGSDPKLKDEAVLYTAHYDHFGIRADEKGDNIYNGAADNATGCGIVLELARAFASLPENARPKRSMIFSSVTAEEQGLLGSEYLGKHPPVPAGKIALDLNYDDVPPIGTPEEVEVSGSERTTLYPQVVATAKAFGLTIRPDARPEAGHYYRSDHFSLSRVGIPAFSVNEGMKFVGHPAEWGMEQAKDYTDHRYHEPSDEYDPKWDFAGDAVMGRFGFALGWQAANAAAVQGWQNGDEFEKARMK